MTKAWRLTRRVAAAASLLFAGSVTPMTGALRRAEAGHRPSDDDRARVERPEERVSISPNIRFVYGQTVLMLVVLVGLTALGTMTYDLFFMISLSGFLVMMELTEPFEVTPRWRSNLKWILVAGLLVFGYIAVDRLYGVLLQELAA